METGCIDGMAGTLNHLNQYPLLQQKGRNCGSWLLVWLQLAVVRMWGWAYGYIMWRSKPKQFRTTNLCNEFLAVHLQRKKQQFDQIGMPRKAMVYQTALLTIKKYPLPIISPLQLKTLYGVGDQLAQELESVIRKHYRQFLKDRPNTHTQEPDTQENDTQKSYSASLPHSYHSECPERQLAVNEDDSRSVYSMKSASVSKPYKPRPKTQAAYLLLALKGYSQAKFITKQTLKEFVRSQFNQTLPVKTYTLLLENLLKGSYIEVSGDGNSVCLTPLGLTHAEALDHKTKAKDSKAKIKNLLSSFKSNLTLHDKKPLCEPKLQRTHELIPSRGKQGLVLLIDCRQIKDKSEQNFFETKLRERYNIDCRTANLPIGDFMWLYHDQVLDYAVERKKADDLASSIHDGRYKEQKYRLRGSGVTNLYYLYEGHLTGQNARSEREVAGALMSTRVKEGFRVVQLANINESLKFISFLTDSISERLEKEENIETHGDLQQFTTNNGKSAQLTVQHIFGLTLKTIPGVGKASVNELLKYFSTPYCLYTQLQQLSTRIERVEFLRELLKGGGVRTNVPELLVDLLFVASKK